jgi:hypothetical protein
VLDEKRQARCPAAGKGAAREWCCYSLALPQSGHEHHGTDHLLIDGCRPLTAAHNGMGRHCSHRDHARCALGPEQDGGHAGAASMHVLPPTPGRAVAGALQHTSNNKEAAATCRGLRCVPDPGGRHRAAVQSVLPAPPSMKQCSTLPGSTAPTGCALGAAPPVAHTSSATCNAPNTALQVACQVATSGAGAAALPRGCQGAAGRQGHLVSLALLLMLPSSSPRPPRRGGGARAGSYSTWMAAAGKALLAAAPSGQLRLHHRPQPASPEHGAQGGEAPRAAQEGRRRGRAPQPCACGSMDARWMHGGRGAAERRC